MKNVTYISPTIQNELIDIIAHDVIQKDIIEEIEAAKFFSIIAMKSLRIMQKFCHFVFYLLTKMKMLEKNFQNTSELIT